MKNLKTTVLWLIMLLVLLLTAIACQNTSVPPKDYQVDDFCLRRGQSITVEELDIPESVTFKLKDPKQTGIITLSNEKIGAIKTGSVAVIAYSGDYETEFTVHVVSSTNMYDPSLVMCAGESVDFNSFSTLNISPIQETYEIISGHENAVIEDSVITAIGVGTVTVKAQLQFAEPLIFDITVIPSYTIEANDMSLFVNQSAKINPTINTSRNQEFVYQAVEGEENIILSGNTVIAQKCGQSKIRISSKEFPTAYCFISVNITYAPYEIVADNTIYVERDLNKLVTYSFKSNSNFFNSNSKVVKSELVEGAEFIEYNSERMRISAKKIGSAKIRLYVEGEEETFVNVVVIKPAYEIEAPSVIDVNEGEVCTLNASISNSAIVKTIEYELVSGDSIKLYPSGYIESIKSGESVIKCFVRGERFTYVTVNVLHVDYKIDIPDPVLLYKGRSLQISYSVSPVTKNFAVELIENNNDCISLDVKTMKIFANNNGTAKIKFTPTYSPECAKVLDVTVENIPYNIALNIESLEVDFTQTLEFKFTSEHSDFDPNKNFEVSIISGAENVKFYPVALTVKGIKVGNVEILCRVEDGIEKTFTIHVDQRGYVIQVSSFISIKLFETYQLDAKIVPDGREEVIKYKVSVGNCITVDDNGLITANAVGIAEIKCYVENGRQATVLVEVKNIDYVISSDNSVMFDSKTAEITYSISPASSNVLIEVIEGEDLIMFTDETNFIALTPGEVKIRLYSEVNPEREKIITVTINSLISEVPEGYYKLSDYLYVNHKPGYHSQELDLKYFTPYNDATIYYTMDKSMATVYSDVFMRSDSIKIKADQRGNTMATTPLMVSVVPHTGGNANVHGSYVNNYYNQNSYPSISVGTVINAIVVRNGETVYSTTNTYIAETNKSYYSDYPIVSLYMSYEDWMGNTGMYNRYTQDIYKRVNLEFFDKGESFSVNSQVKIAGGWSVGWPQRTMHLNFSKDQYGNKQDSVRFEIFGEDVVTEDGEDFLDTFTRFRLHNGGSCHDGANGSANVNDALIHELCKNVTNVSTTEYRPAIVYLNGEYWGYYLLREHYSNDYYKYNFDVPESAVQYVDHRGTPQNNIYNRYYLEDGDIDTFTPFLEEMYTYIGHSSTKTNADGTKTTVSAPAKNFNDPTVYNEFINKFIDVDSFIDYVLIEAYCDNWDCMTNGNNYRMWRVDPTNPKVDPTNPYCDGKLRFSLHDLDMALSPAYNANNRLVSLANASKYIKSTQGGSYQVNDLLAALMKSDLFRARLLERLVYLVKNVFTTARVAAKLDEMHAELTPIYADSKTRWCWNLTLNTIRSRMNNIINFFNYRYEWFKTTLEEDFATYHNGIAGVLPESEDDNITGVTYEVNNYNDGNGSTSANRAQINTMPDGTAMSMTDFDMTFTSIAGAVASYGGEQIHMKFIYGTANFVVRVNTGADTLLVSKIQNGPTVTGMAKLKTGSQKWRVEKRGTVMKIWIDGTLVMNFELINSNGVAITHPITQIDFYQHRMNRTIRNFYLKKYA